MKLTSKDHRIKLHAGDMGPVAFSIRKGEKDGDNFDKPYMMSYKQSLDEEMSTSILLGMRIVGVGNDEQGHLVLIVE